MPENKKFCGIIEILLLNILLLSHGFAAWDKVNRSLETYGDYTQIILPLTALSYSIHMQDYRGTLYFA